MGIFLFIRLIRDQTGPLNEGIICYHLCKRIFKRCGRHVNIERKVFFASGIDIEIGEYSGIGINAHIPNGAIFGE